jgi:type I restriction enzyme S subunit
MKNYKPLGKYIQPVDERNTALEDLPLVGLSISKNFINSVANIIGTDLSNYKIIRSKQFACSLMQVSRDEKIPIAMYTSDRAIMSPAYPIFEIADTSILMPEYLMMWFSRNEFDRQASYFAVGGVRGNLPWEDFCDMQLPIPTITKQREIVKEYNVIQNRIALNQQLIQKLEETAQAIYKQWFVEFEFPDENGNPYKSSGGEMEESELREIPVGWQSKEISSICDITSSKRIFENEYESDGIPFYRGKEITLKKAGEVITEPIYISKERYTVIVKSFGKPKKGDILMTAVGTIGSTYMVQEEEFYFKDGNVVWFKNFKKDGANYFIYDFMQSENFISLIKEITIGSTQNAITITTFGGQKVIFPSDEVLLKYKLNSVKLNECIVNKKNQNLKLFELKDLILSKMTKIETEKEVI